MKWLIFGSKGWIGGKLKHILIELGEDTVDAQSRAENAVSVACELDDELPDRVVCAIGRTHGAECNTIDYLEQKGKLVENMRDNLFAPVQLAMLCAERGIHLTYIGTGCIFNGYKGYTENDLPDFFGSSYSVVKGFTDMLMHLPYLEKYVLNARIRMPVTSEMNDRNFISKIVRYEKICSMPNSMTVLPELLPVLMKMALCKKTGTINLVNAGVIDHNEILEMYCKHVDSNHTWKNITVEELDALLAASRSNNMLDTNKLHELYPSLRTAREAINNVMKKFY